MALAQAPRARDGVLQRLAGRKIVAVQGFQVGAHLRRRCNAIVLMLGSFPRIHRAEIALHTDPQLLDELLVGKVQFRRARGHRKPGPV